MLNQLKLLTQLAEPLASCKFLILGERIAGRSAFEFILIVRALSRNLPVCILLDSPAADSTVYASWLSGFNVSLTLNADVPIYQDCFTRLREDLETMETPA